MAQGQDPELGRMWTRYGSGMLLVGSTLGSVVFAQHSGSVSTMLAAALGATLLSILLVVCGTLAVSYGRRLQVAPGDQVVAEAPDRVFFLRSFQQDALLIPGVGYGFEELPTPEQLLERRLEPAGRMFGIGRPREFAPPIGAPRIYAGPNWQSDVLRNMHGSRLTVLAFGASPGLRWELQAALDHVPPERLLLWTPTRDSWRLFRAFAAADPRWRLRLPTLSADVQLLAFHQDGRPRVLEVHGTIVGSGDFTAGRFVPDPTAEGEVEPGGLPAYLATLPPSPPLSGSVDLRRLAGPGCLRAPGEGSRPPVP